MWYRRVKVIRVRRGVSSDKVGFVFVKNNNISLHTSFIKNEPGLRGACCIIGFKTVVHYH